MKTMTARARTRAVATESTARSRDGDEMSSTSTSTLAYRYDYDDFEDDDDFEEDEEEFRIASATAWLGVLERATTLGAVSSGIASVVMREMAFGALAGTLPLVGALARRARERRLRARAAARAAARRDEMLALRIKTARSVTLREATKQAAPLAVEAVKRDVTPVLEELSNRLSNVERAQVEAAKTAAATARDSGAVAGMLARDLAAARVDAREGIASVRDEFRSTAETAAGELRKEMTMLWELVENVEKDTASLRKPMEELAVDIRGAMDGEGERIASSSGGMSSEQLEDLRAIIADTTSAKVREAMEQLLGSIQNVTSEESIVQNLASKLDESQWEAMIGRLDAIDANVNAANRRVEVNEDDLEDLRIEIRQEISKDIQDIVESVNELKAALSKPRVEPSTNDERGSGSVEAAAAVKQWAEEKLQAATPSVEVEEQMKWQAAIIEADDTAVDELVWVGEESQSQSAKLNQGVSRDEAFANMQALLNAKTTDAAPKSEKSEEETPVSSDDDDDENAAVSAEVDEEVEEIWDPFVGAADAENVAKYMAENQAKESGAKDDDFAAQSEAGLSALRAGRDVARRSGTDVDMLEDADEKFAEAIKHFEKACAVDASSLALGNLGNAHLARGRVQSVLAELALQQAQAARTDRVNAGLEGTAEMYVELAEDNLIQAGRQFRAVVVDSQSEDSEDKDDDKRKAKALNGWGTALTLRSELVLTSEGSTGDAEALAVAAAEKFKAAAALEPESVKIYVSWGDALRLSASLGTVEDEDERLFQAQGCYREALRLQPEYPPALEGLRLST
jgi:tetratricopeptide (TPR) repeat protein